MADITPELEQFGRYLADKLLVVCSAEGSSTRCVSAAALCNAQGLGVFRTQVSNPARGANLSVSPVFAHRGLVLNPE